MKIKFNFFSGIYQLESEQIIKASLEEVWDFFSSPKNLNKITPKDMQFEITSSIVDQTYQGQIITYKIQLMPLVKTSWVTEITSCDEGNYFVDEQRFGPYTMWHHEHHFKELGNGKVLMVDRVSYKLPFGLLGRLVAGNLIKNKVRGIFKHRFDFINSHFN